MGETQRWSAWIGRTMVDPTGDHLGQIIDIYVDEHTNQAEWATISIGGPGEVRFVPLSGARAEDDLLVIPRDRRTVEAAPRLPYDGALTDEDEAELYAHYGLTTSYVPTFPGPPEALPSSPSAEAVASSTPEAPEVAVTRSEEELRVSTVPREAGRVRLRKWVEAENVSEFVPVAHEELRVERQPINAANVDEAMADAELEDSEYEVVLHEEHVVASKVTVPKERVRLEKRVVVDEQPIEAELRKERVDVERHDSVR